MTGTPEMTHDDYDRIWPEERQPILRRAEVEARLLISDFSDEPIARVLGELCISHVALQYRIWCLESDLYDLALSAARTEGREG